MPVPSPRPELPTIIAQCAVWSTAWLTVASGFEKQRRPSRSIEMWRRISAGRVGDGTGRMLTIALGMVELAVGLLALISPGPTTAWALAMFLALLAAGAALTVATSGGKPMPCGCFGERGGNLSWGHVALNASLAALTINAVVFGHLDRSTGLSTPAALVTAAVALGAAAIWWWLYAQAGSSPYKATAHSE